jgi:hypothetical protein
MMHLLGAGGYRGVFFDRRYNGVDRVEIDRVADCIVGFKVTGVGVAYKLVVAGQEVMSGVSSGSGDGIFTTGEQPVQDRYNDREGFTINELDNVHAELVGDPGVVVGRNYLPMIRVQFNSWQIVLSEPSDVVVYYMGLNDEIRREFARREHMIEIYGHKYFVKGDGVQKKTDVNI